MVTPFRVVVLTLVTPFRNIWIRMGFGWLLTKLRMALATVKKKFGLLRGVLRLVVMTLLRLLIVLVVVNRFGRFRRSPLRRG